MGRLDGRTALITGGAGGIGKEAGRLFAAEGANVVLVDLDAGALKAACDEIGSNAVSWVAGDVTDPESTKAFVAETVARHGGIDVFLANAGIEGKVGSIVDSSLEDFERVMSVNVRGVYVGLQAVIPEMAKRGRGSIVITSSVAGLGGTAGLAPYVTSKHAVVGLMRSAALECAPLGIRVNSVHPSPVNTRMMRSLEEGFAPGGADAARESFAQRIPLRRYGEPGDIARSMLYLASDDSEFVTGSMQVVDGGMTA